MLQKTDKGQSMRLHILSDLHNEYSEYLPSAATKEADVVILAGDIDVGIRGMTWAENTFKCPVLYVPGNHEFYHHSMHKLLKDMRNVESNNVKFLDMNEVIIGGVRFLGATAWTDFTATGNQFLAEQHALRAMKDFKTIKTGEGRLITPRDLISKSIEAKEWLQSKLDERFFGKTVVITHHAPILESLADTPYEPSHLDSAFANNWLEFFSGTVDVWIHGHTHTSVNYDANGTHVISNQRGYPGETTGFNPNFVINL